MQRYKVEPYVVAADVYSVRAARRARRLDLVHRLGRLDVSRRRRVRSSGFGVQGDALQLDPCIPRPGRASRSTLRYRGAVYEISVRNLAGVSRGVVAATLDGVQQPISQGNTRMKLCDGGVHAIGITLG